MSACGDEQAEGPEKGHGLKQEDADRLNANMQENMEIIAAVTPETVDTLSTALTGNALAETKAGIDQDLAQGRIRKRDYRNIVIELDQYNTPIASMRVEFEDFGYYVDASTGEPQSAALGDKQAFAMSVVEEDGRWKIRGIFNTADETTPRELPDSIPQSVTTQPAETNSGQE